MLTFCKIVENQQGSLYRRRRRQFIDMKNVSAVLFIKRTKNVQKYYESEACNNWIGIKTLLSGML